MSFPYIIITEEERDTAFKQLQDLKYSKTLTLSHSGNKASGYYFNKYRIKTKCGKWSFYSAWQDKEQRAKIIQGDKQLHKNSPNIIGTPAGLQSSMRMRYCSANQFKPYVAVNIYLKFKPTRILDISAGWGDRLVGAMSKNIDYIGIDSNTNLKKPYDEMIKHFSKISTSKIKMIFKKSQNVNYSKLGPYDLIFTSPPYFFLEEYEHMTITDEETFIKDYLEPTINNSFQYLTKGGHMALNIPIKLYKIIMKFMGKANGKIKMPIQNRHAYKDSTPKSEFIYYWKK